MRDLCLALDGDWIDAGGGSNGKINPLQIRPTPVDDDDKYYQDEGNGMGDMAIYIKNLNISSAFTYHHYQINKKQS